MLDQESIGNCFNQIQLLVNSIKAYGESVTNWWRRFWEPFV